MSDVPDKDPFREQDPRAAEREARRREREEKRRRRSAGARRSLADRVSGAMGGSPADPQEPVAPQPAPVQPEADQSPPQPAAQPQQPQPAAPPPADEPVSQPEPAAPAAEDEWLADLDRKVDTGEWLTEDAAAPVPPPSTAQQPVAPAPTPAPVPAEPATGTHTDDWETYGSVPRTRDTGGDDGTGVPIIGAGPPSDGRQKWMRRLIALGVLLVGLGAIVLVAKGLSGEEEPPPAAAGPKKLKTFSLTIPEGLTISQMAEVVEDADVKGSYEKAVAKAEKKFSFEDYGADGTESLEGFLFPATYDLEQGAPAEDVVAKQLEAFEMNFGSVDMKQAEKKNLTPYDVLTIASLIEEEVQIEKERPLVGAVIYNRLAAGDTLGIDATLRYELEKYDGQLLESELDADTPYNTRVNAGLPPTPIASPGLASMEAAAAPAKSDAYYFVVKPGTCGEHFFTEDAAEFEQAAAEYTAALNAEGGSPTDC